MNALAPSIPLSGKPLTFAAMARIGAHLVTLTADPVAMRRVERSREVIEARIAAGYPVYGSTTGVGAMKDVQWSADELETFNLGLVRAHHFGTGTPFPNSSSATPWRSGSTPR